MSSATPSRPRSTLLSILLLWIAFYASFTLLTPPLLDDADSVHAEVAREMLLRHDYVTLYANGIRYLEKAPLLYWSMAATMRLSQLLGATGPQALTVAARIPLALTILALALLTESFARRLFASTHAGLYAALITLSSFGIFLFTRITIPDGMVCLWTTLALYCLWRTDETPRRHFSYGFAIACALNVLTKGLIGIVFPLAIALLYLLMAYGITGATARLRRLPLATSLLLFLAIAAPWHILAGLANPTQGQPTPFHFLHGHWQVPLPTDGNVRGWFWFYFMNEHLLRYLNLRVPHDYDTAPLWLFWGLCLIWLMPWSVFLPRAIATPLRRWIDSARQRLRTPTQIFSRFNSEISGPRLLLILWAALPLLFFSLSTRQEYYVLPALPAFALLVAGWLSLEVKYQASASPLAIRQRHRNDHAVLFALVFGSLFTLAALCFLLHTRAPAPNTDLAQLLAQNPGDYALSMGHFLDLNTQALGLFRLPLAIAALGLFVGPLAAFLLRKKNKPHGANLALAAGAFTFLLAAHLGLQIFAPVLTTAQLATAIAPQVQPNDLIIIHGEYEAGSTLGFYLQRPDLDLRTQFLRPLPNTPQFIHILEGRSSNLWYGSFFPDAPKIFETPATLAAKWQGPQRIFLWQSLTAPPNQLPTLPGPVYILIKSGGKEILSNRPNP
jgi:4-amino-4-deoxy-L-arabinose transferase-like glycosyltransferase